MLYTKNNSLKLKKELLQLKIENKDLLKLILNLYHWVDINLKKDVIITMIYRTKEQQDIIYKNTKRGDREYNKNPWKSPHQFWTAIDIRSKIYTKEEQKKIVNYLNNKYNNTNYYKWTSKVHEINNFGMHFHIQYIKK